SAVCSRSPLSTMPAGNIVPAPPQRSPPSLLTTAACGGLTSAPDCRSRRASSISRTVTSRHPIETQAQLLRPTAISQSVIFSLILRLAAENSEVLKRFDPWKEEVGPTLYGCKSGQALYLSSDWSLRNCKVKRAILGADHRIVLIAQLVKIWIVCPNV